MSQIYLDDRHGEMYLSIVDFANVLGTELLANRKAGNPEIMGLLRQAQRMVLDAGIVGRYVEWYLVGRLGEEETKWLLSSFLRAREQEG